MIWIPLLLATLAESAQGQASRGRLAQLKGRLGLGGPPKTFMRRIWDGIARERPEAIPWLEHAYRIEEINNPDAWVRSDGVVLRWLAEAIEYPSTDVRVLIEAISRVIDVFEVGDEADRDTVIDYAREFANEDEGVKQAWYHAPDDARGDSMEIIRLPEELTGLGLGPGLQLAWVLDHEPSYGNRVALTLWNLLVLSGPARAAEELEANTMVADRRVYAGPGVHRIGLNPEVPTNLFVYDLQGPSNVVPTLESLFMDEDGVVVGHSDWGDAAMGLLSLRLNAPEEDLGALFWIRAQIQDYVRVHGDGALWHDAPAGRRAMSMEGVLDELLDAEIEAQRETEDDDRELGEDDEVVVATFEDGGRLVELLTEVALAVEGSRMKHCVGKPAHGHPGLLKKGAVRIFSYRDPSGKPKATLEISTESRQITDLEGPHNGVIHDDDARARMAWLAGPGLTGYLVTNHRLRGVTPAQVRLAASQLASYDPERLQ